MALSASRKQSSLSRMWCRATNKMFACSRQSCPRQQLSRTPPIWASCRGLAFGGREFRGNSPTNAIAQLRFGGQPIKEFHVRASPRPRMTWPSMTSAAYSGQATSCRGEGANRRSAWAISSRSYKGRADSERQARWLNDGRQYAPWHCKRGNLFVVPETNALVTLPAEVKEQLHHLPNGWTAPLPDK